MDKRGPFTTPQAARVLGIPMRKVLSYIERGYVGPSLRDATGHGSSRQWDLWDVDKIYLIRQCELFGVSVKGLRTIGETLVPPLWPKVLLKNRDYPWLVMNRYGHIADLRLPLEEQMKTVGTPALVINWRDIMVEVQEMIDKTVL